jgi:tRNA dimethylallyltransferase
VTALVIAGPTGVGKSDLAIRLALELGGEIVNFDSVQIYRGFDIGSAKTPAERRQGVPHHLLDVVDADGEFNAADYARAASIVCAGIEERGRMPILVGGTFFYLRALLSVLAEMPGRSVEVRALLRAIADKPRGAARLHRRLSKIDPQSGRNIAPGDRHRVERALEVWIESGRPISSWAPPADADERFATIKIALTLERHALAARIDERVAAMYREGLVDETRSLLARFSPSARPFGAIGYREAVAVIAGEMTLDQAIAETCRRTRAYAKRQMTWLRSERNVHWLDASDPDSVFSSAVRLARSRESSNPA